MRYWRLFVVSFLLTFTISGCHRRRQQVLPPPQAQAPVVNVLPPLPSLTLQTVQLATPKPAPPPAQPAPVEQAKKHPERTRRRQSSHKTESENAAGAPRSSSSGSSTREAASISPTNSSVVGKLSADDSASSPDQTARTQRLIDSTENLLKRVSARQVSQHKNDIAQVDSFLAQARQALSMNDLVGAQTLANKAKIMVDELLK
jgi:hypothetical protein